MTARTVVESVTCLGCGCTCDDIGVAVQDDRIVDRHNICPLGSRWFGDGAVPLRSIVDGADVPLDRAVHVAAAALRDATRARVYLAPGLSCESQREAVGIADLLRARLDSATANTARFVLATQERGFAAATFGEVRNRADVVVFWGVDIAQRYPRFPSRYAPEPAGMHLQAPRRVIAVDVGEATSSVAAGERVRIDARDELGTLTALRALALGQPDVPSLPAARQLWSTIGAGHYVALVFDAEPDDRAPRSCARFDALVALSQALNDRVRCAAIAMRGGGNRSGADSVLVAQTGYPFAVDFGRGFPRYDPHTSSTERADVTLVVGDLASIPADALRDLEGVRCIAIGPHASRPSLGSASIRIDTGVDGIHASGTAVRADEVPLPLRAFIPGPVTTSDVLASLANLLRRRPRP